jgi:hypothetical protein
MGDHSSGEVETYLTEESDTGNIIVILYTEDDDVVWQNRLPVNIRFYYKADDVKKIYDVGGPQALKKLAEGYVATLSSETSALKVTTWKDLIVNLRKLQDKVQRKGMARWDSQENATPPIYFSLNSEQLSALVPGFAVTQAVMFSMPLQNLSAGIYSGMPPPVAQQWDKDLDNEAKIESQSRNFAYFIGLFGMSILFTLLDLTATRNSAGKNLDLLDKLRTADMDRQSQYSKYVELQDGSFTSVTRILSFVIGVTGFVVTWTQLLATFRTAIMQNTREVQQPVVAQVTLKFLSG